MAMARAHALALALALALLTILTIAGTACALDCKDMLTAGLMNTYAQTSSSASSSAQMQSTCSIDAAMTYDQYNSYSHDKSQSSTYESINSKAEGWGVKVSHSSTKSSYHMSESEFKQFSARLTSFQKAFCGTSSSSLSASDLRSTVQTVVPPGLFDAFLSCQRLESSGVYFKQSFSDGFLYVDLVYRPNTGETTVPTLRGISVFDPAAVHCSISGQPGKSVRVMPGALLDMQLQPHAVYSIRCAQLHAPSCGRSNNDVVIVTSRGAGYRAYMYGNDTADGSGATDANTTTPTLPPTAPTPPVPVARVTGSSGAGCAKHVPKFVLLLLVKLLLSLLTNL